MKSRKFKIGEHVIVLSDRSINKGRIGTVFYVDDWGIEVELDGGYGCYTYKETSLALYNPKIEVGGKVMIRSKRSKNINEYGLVVNKAWNMWGPYTPSKHSRVFLFNKGRTFIFRNTNLALVD